MKYLLELKEEGAVKVLNARFLTTLFVLMLLLSTSYTFLDSALSLPSDSMWIEPESLGFCTMFTSVGDRFNVTVWLNVTSPTMAWQFYLIYNSTQLNATRCSYTGEGKSAWSGDLPANTVQPAFGSHNATHDYVLYGEELKSSAEKTGAGSLSWVEFEILQAPSVNETITSELRLDIVGVFQSSAYNNIFEDIPLWFGKATYAYTYASDAMWIEPEALHFYSGNMFVGDRFNVTVWLNVTTLTNAWQFYLIYNSTQLNATRCDYTGEGQSAWSADLPVDTIDPWFGAHNATHECVLLGEVLKYSAEKTGCGSLSWVEFEILQAPGVNETLTSELRLDIEGIFTSYAYTADPFNTIPLCFGKTIYAYTYAPDVMWIEPQVLRFHSNTTFVGDRFNVTVWLNATSPTNTWQFYLIYNKTQLAATRCNYTGNDKSLWSADVPTDTVTAAFGEHNSTHNYVLHAEALKDYAEKTGAGNLSWVEFEILQAPGVNETLTSELRIDIIGVFQSHALNKDFEYIPLCFVKATYAYTYAFIGLMWIKPPNLLFYGDLMFVGDRFNVTVWLNVTSLTNTWQFYLIYNSTQLNATRCDYTGEGQSAWSDDLPVDTAIASLGTHNATHNYVLHGEVLKNNGEKAGTGSLSWIEFEILQAPDANETLTSELRLDVEGLFSSVALDKDYNELPLAFDKAKYTYAPPPVRDIAVINVKPVQSIILKNQTVDVDVTIQNQGETNETLTVTCYANTAVIGTMQLVDFPSGALQKLTFAWNTTGMSDGVYVISANASEVWNEEDTSDNGFVDGTITVLEIPPGWSIFPRDNIFYSASTPIHTRFNITICLADVSNVFLYQTRLYYNNTLLTATRAWIPTWDPLYVFSGKSRQIETIFFEADNIMPVALLNIGQPTFSGTGLIAIVEFEIIYTPLGGDVSCVLDIDNVWTVLNDPDYNIIETDITNGYYLYDALTHDVAVTNVHTMKSGSSPISVVCHGMSMEVYATIENHGEVTETFEVTAYANSTVIGLTQVTLAPSENASLIFVWDTTTCEEYGNYTIRVTAEQVAGEVDLIDNTLVDGFVLVSHMGDVTGDGKVDIADVARASSGFGCIRINDPSDPRYGEYWHPIACDYCPHDPNADVNCDKVIDIQDLSRTSGNFGWHT